MADATEDTRITFRYLSEPDMIAAGVKNMAACVDAMEDMFRLLMTGDYRMAGAGNNSHGAWVMFPEESPFPGMPLDGPDRRFMAMPAYLGGDYQHMGMKWYGSNVANRDHGLPRSILVFILNDPDTGAPKAFMSANILSAMRTGAVPGVGARYFANPESKVLGIVGPGVMNRTSLMAFMVECPKIDTVKIKGRSQKSIDAFIAFVKDEYPNVKNFEVVDSVEAAVRGADVVTIAVSSREKVHRVEDYPLVKRAWVKPGAFLSLPADTSVDDALMAGDVVKAVDHWGLYEAWAEELPAPHHAQAGLIGNYFMDKIEAGELDESAIVDLGRVITGQIPGRTDPDQIVLYSVGGMPVEDVAWATKVYENAVRDNIGTELLLWDKPAFA
ncbi:MAG: tyramine oxidase subunit B [Nakamurella sp.]